MRIYRAKPIAWTDSSVALLNECGATLCTPDREATPLDLPEVDEIVLSPDGVMYTCWFENESFRVQAYRFEAEAFKPAGPLVLAGWSFGATLALTLGVFPVCAGMSPTLRWAARTTRGFPRMRGDEPMIDVHSSFKDMFSPHLRG